MRSTFLITALDPKTATRHVLFRGDFVSDNHCLWVLARCERDHPGWEDFQTEHLP